MDYAKQYQEYLVRANQALEKACEIFLPEESEVCRAARYSLLHGGVVVEVKDMDYELVARPDAMQLHLRDHGKAVDISKASAKLTLLAGTEKQEVELKPAGDKLEARGVFKVAANTKVVAVVSIAGKSSTARFVLK